jgi:hypothetical protein
MLHKYAASGSVRTCQNLAAPQVTEHKPDYRQGKVTALAAGHAPAEAKHRNELSAHGARTLERVGNLIKRRFAQWLLS